MRLEAMVGREREKEGRSAKQSLSAAPGSSAHLFSPGFRRTFRSGAPRRCNAWLSESARHWTARQFSGHPRGS